MNVATENYPTNWKPETLMELQSAIFDVVMDPDPVVGRKIPDPVEPWESWEIRTADKNDANDRVILSLVRDEFGIIFTMYREGGNWELTTMAGRMEDNPTFFE